MSVVAKVQKYTRKNLYNDKSGMLSKQSKNSAKRREYFATMAKKNRRGEFNGGSWMRRHEKGK
jgi:hypothetical protein